MKPQATLPAEISGGSRLLRVSCLYFTRGALTLINRRLSLRPRAILLLPYKFARHAGPQEHSFASHGQLESYTGHTGKPLC